MLVKKERIHLSKSPKRDETEYYSETEWFDSIEFDQIDLVGIWK